MAGSQKSSTNQRRHGQLVSSSSCLPTAHSKRNSDLKAVIGNERTFNMVVQPNRLHPDEDQEMDRPGDEKEIVISSTGKTTISRRRISSNITPQASPRTRRKGGPEKENVKVEDTPLRRTIGRSATSSTLRRTPSPFVVPRTAIVKNAQGSLGSTDSESAKSALSSAFKLSGKTSSSTLTQQRTFPKSRTMLSLGTSARDNCIVTSARQDDAHQLLLPPTPLKIVPRDGLAPRGNAVKLPETPSKLDSSLCDRDASDTPDVSTDSRPSSASAKPFDDSPSKPFGPLDSESYINSACSASIQTMSPRSSRQSSIGVQRTSILSPLGNPVYSPEDSQPRKNLDDDPISVDEENNYELAVVHIGHEDPLWDKSHEGASEPASTTEARTSSISQAVLSMGVPDNDVECPGNVLLPMTKSAGDVGPEFACDTDVSLVKTGGEQQAIICSSMKFANIERRNNKLSSATELTTPKSQRPSAPSTPPSTPVQTPPPQGASPATSGATAQTSLPPSLFPRLFTELASTYAHLGFGSRSSFNGGTIRGAIDSQTERTQKELANLRAGSGTVLERARVFGQTIWTPSPKAESSMKSEAGEQCPELSKRTSVHGMQVSDSGSVQTPPPSPVSVVGTSAPSETPRKGERRTLGCANVMRAVAMAQHLWKTKNFVLE